MELYLQFGYGMMGHSRVLIERWNGGSVILSPRDLQPNQIINFAQDIISLNGSTLIDPQLYDPRADHHGLVKHDYWPDSFSTNMLIEDPSQSELLRKIRELNETAFTSEYIIPGIFCQRVNDDWIAIQESLIRGSQSIFSDKKKLATIALSAESLRFEEQIEALLLRAEAWEVDGYYVVAERPNQQYLVEDPLWLTNILLLCAGLKLHGRKVILGYCSHQMLSCAITNIDAIASGSYLNVRLFTTGKFREEEDNEKRKSTWYYCPQSLSEYKIPFLDMGHRAGQLNQLSADRSLGSDFADILFSGVQPSLTGFGEQLAFRHYLQCLHEQVYQATRQSFRDAIAAQELLLETAEGFIRNFYRLGIRGQHRDFGNILDVNRAALAGFENSRGFIMDRMWT